MNKKIFVLNFTIRILIVNLTGLILLWDTISFNQGLVSLQSLIYCLSSFSLYIFIFLETLFAYLQYYGLNFEFINLVLFVALKTIAKSIFITLTYTNLHTFSLHLK